MTELSGSAGLKGSALSQATEESGLFRDTPLPMSWLLRFKEGRKP